VRNSIEGRSCVRLTINGYKYKSPNCYINKELETVADFEGELREASSVLDPVFEVKSDANLANINYCYIAAFNRYYYITNVVWVVNNLWRIFCHVDVLMTYKPNLLQHDAIIARNKELYNLYINDGESFKVTQNSRVVEKTFPQGFTGESYVLILVGDDD